MSVTVAWVDGNGLTYKIYRDTSPMDPQDLPEPIGEVLAGVQQFVDTKVAANTLYYYRVGAVRGANEEISSEFQITTGDSADVKVRKSHFDELDRSPDDFILLSGDVQTGNDFLLIS